VYVVFRKAGLQFSQAVFSATADDQLPAVFGEKFGTGFAESGSGPGYENCAGHGISKFENISWLEKQIYVEKTTFIQENVDFVNQMLKM